MQHYNVIDVPLYFIMGLDDQLSKGFVFLYNNYGNALFLTKNKNLLFYIVVKVPPIKLQLVSHSNIFIYLSELLLFIYI